MRIQILIVLLACAASHITTVAQEEEPRSAALRGNILKRGLLGKGKTTTTTTTAAPEEEPEYEDEAEYPAEGESHEPSTEAPASSTEGKKLVAGGVRPFRSNTDLLETLKRRRAQAAEAKLHGHSGSTAASVVQESIATEAPVKSSYSKKRFNNAPQKESNSEPSSAPIKPIRGRFGKPAARTAPEPEPEEQNDAAPSTRTGRAFARRN